MMIYVNVLKNRWIYNNILVIYQNIKVKQIQEFHRSVIDFNISTFSRVKPTNHRKCIMDIQVEAASGKSRFYLYPLIVA